MTDIREDGKLVYVDEYPSPRLEVGKWVPERLAPRDLDREVLIVDATGAVHIGCWTIRTEGCEQGPGWHSYVQHGWVLGPRYISALPETPI